jgi:hypothetical protein
MRVINLLARRWRIIDSTLGLNQIKAALDYLFAVPFKLTQINHSACHSLVRSNLLGFSRRLGIAKAQGGERIKNKGEIEVNSLRCLRIEIIKRLQLELK